MSKEILLVIETVSNEKNVSKDVKGELQTRKWQDQEGKDRYSTEVILQGYNFIRRSFKCL